MSLSKYIAVGLLLMLSMVSMAIPQGRLASRHSEQMNRSADTLISVRWWSAIDCNGKGAEHRFSIVGDTLKYIFEDGEYIEPVEAEFKAQLLNLLGKSGSKSQTVKLHPYGPDNWEVSVMSSGGALDDTTTCDSIAEELMRVIDANLPLHPDYNFDLSDNKKAGGICRRQPCSGEKKYSNTKNTWNEIELYISYLRDYDYSAAEKITIKDKTITFNDGNTEQSRILSDWELADLNRLLQHINLNGTYLYDWSMIIKIDLNAAKLVVDGKLIFDVHDVRLGIDSHYFIYDYIKCISPVRVSTFD